MSVDPRTIAFVGPYSPYRGGIAHFIETLHDGMQARGHDVHALTFSRQYPERLFPGESQFNPVDAGVRPEAPRMLDSIGPRSWYASSRYLIERGTQVVIFKYWMPFFAPAFGTLARQVRKEGVRVIAVVDNALPHKRRPGDRWLGRYVLGATDGCVVMSDAVARDLETLGVHSAVRQTVHPRYDMFGEGIPRDEARRQLDLRPDAPVLLFFGFIRRYKGLHVLLEAMPNIIAALPHVQLVVAGEFYEDEARCRALIRDFNLEAHVHLHSGYIPNDSVSTYFSAADVVVQPYVTATQSGVTQIAFQFEKPSIVTDVGGLSEIVPHERAGLVVPPEQPQALASAVVRFFEENMSSTLVAGVKACRDLYGWDPLYEAIETLF